MQFKECTQHNNKELERHEKDLQPEQRLLLLQFLLIISQSDWIENERLNITTTTCVQRCVFCRQSVHLKCLGISAIAAHIGLYSSRL